MFTVDKGMKKVFIWVVSAVVAVVAVAAFVWFANPFDVRDRMLASQIVNMRVAPKRLENPKTPSDYGMQYSDVDIVTADNIRLWHQAPQIRP